MTCYHPVPVWRSKEVNASGKRPVVFAEHLGIDGTRFDLPCGKCIGCRLDRAQEWRGRLMHELQDHRLSAFLTLTYSDANLPAGGVLVKKHMQDFLKRLRKATGGGIRFFACGEYGDTTQRPHYHAIIFGHDWADKKMYKTTKQGNKLYMSESLNSMWGHGNCWIGAVTADSCGYVARYIMKKVTGDQAKDHYERVDPKTGEIYQLPPEYIHMSTRPAIGRNFYEKHKKQIHTQDSVVIKGKLQKVPRYYDKQLEKEDPEHLEWLKHIRQQRAHENRLDNTRERLAVKEEIKISRTNMLGRNEI